MFCLLKTKTKPYSSQWGEDERYLCLTLPWTWRFAKHTLPWNSEKKKKIRRYFHGVTYFTQCQHSEATQRGDRMSSSHFCSWAHHRQHMRGESQQLSPFILKAHRLDMTALIVYVLYLPSHRGIIITFLHFKTHPLSRPRIACCIVTKVLNSTQMHRDIQM